MANPEVVARDKVRLRKMLRLCHSSQAEEAARAAEAALRLVQALRPTMFRWRRGVRVVTLLYADFLAKQSHSSIQGTTTDVLMVNAQEVVEWRLLKRGRLAILRGDWILILPADEAEPMW